MNAHKVHAETRPGACPEEKPENTAFSRDMEQACCIGFPGAGVPEADADAEENKGNDPPDPFSTDPSKEHFESGPVSGESGPDYPVSILLEHYREEGIAHFFSNENRTYHPFGSGRASGDSGVSLIAGVGHPKTAARPSAAFRDARAKKKGDSNLVGLDLGPQPAVRKTWLPSKPGAHPVRPLRSSTGSGKAIPLSGELFGDDPKQGDRLLASAFEESGAKPIRSVGSSKRLKARPIGTPVHPAVLPILRLPDGEIDLSDPPAARLKESDFSRTDPHLHCLIEAWPTLSPQVRDTIMHAVRNG